MKGGPAPQPAAPAPGPMPGPMPGPAPQQGPAIDVMKGDNPQKQLQKIFMKIMGALRAQGYYDLPENKGKPAAIQEEIMELAQAIVEGDDEFVKSSEIFKFITQKGGQREVLRESVPGGGGPDGSEG